MLGGCKPPLRVSAMKPETAAKQLDRFMAKYTPEIVRLARAILAKMRARLPGAMEMVYDNYNGLVIGFGPSERPSEALFSIVLLPQWVTLCFLTGAQLRDPDRVLKGAGNVVRSVRLMSAAEFDRPAIGALMDQALARAEKPIDESGQRKLIIKSISEVQRPRRPAEPKKARTQSKK
jgi:hypothetical protein